jgi:DNA polymerase III delta subunit
MAGPSKRAATPPDALDAFERELAEAEPLDRLMVVRGDEEYFARRAQEVVTNRAKALDYEILVRDGTDPDAKLDDVLGELATPPMFAPRQLFVLRNWDANMRTQGKNVPPLVAALLAFCARDQPDRAVLVRATSMRADHKIAKTATKNLAVRKLYDSPPPWKPDPMASELVQWVRRRARELEVDVAPRDALYIAAATGNDLGAIDAQLERVRTGTGLLRDSVAWQATGTPWDVADKLVTDDAANGIDAVVALFQGGMTGKDGSRVLDPTALSTMLLSSLSKTVRQGLAIAEARAAGETAERAFDLGGATGRALDAWRPRMNARKHPAQWQRMFDAVSELERASRATGAGVGVDHFVALALRWERQRGSAVQAR